MDFAKIVRATDGTQVVAYVDIDEDGNYILVSAACIDGVVAKVKIGFGSKNDKKKAFAAINGYTVDLADHVASTLKGATSG